MLIITVIDQVIHSILELFSRLTATNPSKVQKVKHPTPSMFRVYRRRVLRALSPGPITRSIKHPTLTLILTLYYATKRLGLGVLSSLAPVSAAAALCTLQQVKLPLSPRSLVTALTRVSLLLVCAYLLLVYIHLACQLVPFAKILFS